MSIFIEPCGIAKGVRNPLGVARLLPGLYAEKIAKSCGITLDESEVLVRSFLAAVFNTLVERKPVYIPGFGRVYQRDHYPKADKKDNPDFAPSRNLCYRPTPAIVTEYKRRFWLVYDRVDGDRCLDKT